MIGSFAKEMKHNLHTMKSNMSGCEQKS